MVVMLFGMVPAAYAADGNADDSTVVAILYDKDGEVDKEYTAAQIAESRRPIMVGENQRTHPTLQLQQDVTIPCQVDSEGKAYGKIMVSVNGVLDLNGHTLTVSTKGLKSEVVSIVSAISAASGNPRTTATIKNGTIVLDTAGAPDGCSFYGLWRGGGALNVEDVTITAASDEQTLTAAMFCTAVPGSATGTDDNITLDNCIFDGESFLATKIGEDDGWSGINDTINVVSGSYPTIADNNGDRITIPEGSKKLTTNPEGVSGSVVTSPDTTAMIVREGHAYLYDTLQEAVDSLPAGEDAPIVYLMKESDETVTLPPETPFKLDTTSYTTGFTGTIQDENGTVLTPSEDGTFESVDVTGITLSQNSLSLTVGESATLTATVTPANATAQTVTWSSSNHDVASVDQNGVVKALREGSATITASVGGRSATCTVSVSEPPYTGKYSYEVFTSVGDNGTISVDRYATEGDKVTIDVTPDEAYLLDELVVTANGKEVELTDNGDGTYTFTMPSADVRISATFAEDPDWTEPEEPATDVSDIFIDVAPNAWYKDAVQYAYENGLMTGVSANEFAPDATTTRGMIVSMLARLEGVESANDAGFADVSDEWYATAVNWAASVGVVNGYEDNTFRPNDAITREQLAAILMNYASYKGEDVSARADLSAYTDQPSAWAEETMSWAVAEGLITGVTNDELQPQGNATRAQVAAILQRFLCK